MSCVVEDHNNSDSAVDRYGCHTKVPSGLVEFGYLG